MENYTFVSKYTDTIYKYQRKDSFYCNLARVGEKKFLFEQDAEFITSITNGFGVAAFGTKSYYLDSKGNIKFPELSLKTCWAFTQFKKAMVQTMDNKYNFITDTGSFVFEEGYNRIYLLSNSLFCLIKNNTTFIFDLNKNILYQEVWKYYN